MPAKKTSTKKSVKKIAPAKAKKLATKVKVTKPKVTKKLTKKTAPAKAKKLATKVKVTKPKVTKKLTQKTAPAKAKKLATKVKVTKPKVTKKLTQKTAPAKAKKLATKVKVAKLKVTKKLTKKAAPAKAKKLATKVKVVKSKVTKKLTQKTAPAKAKKSVTKVKVTKPKVTKKLIKKAAPAKAKKPVTKVKVAKPKITKSKVIQTKTTKTPTGKSPAILKTKKITPTKPVSAASQIRKINRFKTSTKKSVSFKQEFPSIFDVQPSNTISAMEAEQSTWVKYSDSDLEEFRIILQNRIDKEKAELSYLRQAINVSINNGQQGSDSSGNSFQQEQEDTLAIEDRNYYIELISRKVKLLQHLDDALIRIENKTYGICRVTGKLIDKERLKLVPHATLSKKAKDQMNK